MEALLQWISKGEPLPKRHDLSSGIIWATLALCVLPMVFVLPQEGGSDLGRIPIGPTFCSTLMMVGFVVAILVTCLTLVDYQLKKDPSTPLIGAIFLLTGLCEAYFSIALRVQPPFVESFDLFYSDWFNSGLLHVALFALATTVYLFAKKRSDLRVTEKLRLLKRVFVFLLVISAAWLLFLAGKSPLYPQLRRPLEIIPIVCYLSWGLLILPLFIRLHPGPFSRSLMLSILPAILAHAVMSVHQFSFDNRFNLAYFLRIIHYAVPLWGIAMSYRSAVTDEKKTAEKLEHEVKDRTLIIHTLEQREALLASAEQIAGLGSWEFDVETEMVKWSDQMYSIYGYRPGQVTPSMALQENIILPDVRKEVRNKLLSAIRNRSSYSVEYAILRPDGKKRHVLAQGSFVASSKKLVGTVLDISDFHAANKKVARNEALLKEAEAVSHIGSWEWSLVDQSFRWSDEMYRIHGMEPGSENVSEGEYRSLIHPEDRSSFESLLTSFRNPKNDFRHEFRIIRNDGEVRYLSIKGRFKGDKKGRIYKAFGTTQDLTDLKNASIVADKSENIYKTIAKNVPMAAVFMYDEDLNLILHDGPIVSQLPNRQNLEPGSNLRQILSEQEYLHFHPLYLGALNGQVQVFEWETSQKNYQITLTPVKNSAGEVFSLMEVVHDITNIKLAQKGLELKVAELNRSNSDLEQFAYVASHDLQEPLRKIRAFGDRLESKYAAALPDEALDYLNRMKSGAERMQTLIDDLLTFSRLTRNSGAITRTDLAAVIKNVLADLDYTIESSKATFEIAVTCTIDAIPGQIHQLFQNLISNALKFTRSGVSPHIKIRSSIVHDERADVGELPGKTYCQVRIQDNGIGFDKQYSQKIFELFQRLHSRNEYAGTGIGLAVCKKIVENHDGKLVAEAVEGQGATFTIIIPLKQNAKV